VAATGTPALAIGDASVVEGNASTTDLAKSQAADLGPARARSVNTRSTWLESRCDVHRSRPPNQGTATAEAVSLAAWHCSTRHEYGIGSYRCRVSISLPGLHTESWRCGLGRRAGVTRIGIGCCTRPA
jgi:hypothetical protein